MDKLFCFSRAGVSIVLIMFTAPLCAQDFAEFPSSVSLGFGFDDADANDQSIDIVLNGLTFDSSLSLGFARGETRVDRPLSDLTDTFGIDSIQIGWASNPYSAIEFGADYSDWDSEGDFSIASIAPWLALSEGNWTLGLTAESRNIDARFGNGELASFDSRRYTLEVDWFSDDFYWLGASFSSADYSIDVSRIANSQAFIRLSPVARLFSFGLEDSAGELNAGTFLSDVLVDLSWRRSRSAVDDSEADTVSLAVNYPLEEDLYANAEVGSQRSDDSDSVTFFSFTFTAYW
ncbi:MAG: hypothetical protein AAF434_10225 [Pseudomonadota bacterium]